MADLIFNQCIFNTETHQLSTNSKTVTLEPKVASLLHHFLLNSQQVITRDELMRHVWQGTVVTDSTVNWSIAQLRSALDDKKPHIFLKTIPKKGYQWLVDLDEPVVVQSEKVGESPSKPAYMVWLAAALSVIALVAIVYPGQQPSKQVVFGQPVNQDLGSIGYPVFSPDGDSVAYRLDDGEFQYLRLQPLKEHRSFTEYDDQNQAESVAKVSARQPKELTITKATSIRSISWRPDGRGLVWVQTDGDECQISQALLINSTWQVEPITHCSSAGFSHVQYSSADKLYFTDMASDDRYALFELSVGQQRKRLAQSNDARGHLMIVRYHAATEQLAVTEEVAGQTQFNLYQRGELQPLFSTPGRYYDFSWSANGAELILNRGPSLVASYQLSSEQFTTLYHSPLEEVYGWQQNPIDPQQIVMVVNATDGSFIGNGHQQVLADSTFDEFLPALNASGQLAYVSNRRSGNQIWLDGQQLSNIDTYLRFSALTWHPTESMLLGVANGRVQAIDLAKERSWVFSTREQNAANAQWHPVKPEVWFSLQTAQGWQLHSQAIESNKPAPVSEGINAYYFTFTPQADLIYQPYKSCALYRLAQDGSKQQLADDLCIQSSSIGVANNTVWVEGSYQGGRGVYSVSLVDQQVVQHLDRNLYKGRGFSVNQQGDWVAHYLKSGNSRLMNGMY